MCLLCHIRAVTFSLSFPRISPSLFLSVFRTGSGVVCGPLRAFLPSPCWVWLLHKMTPLASIDGNKRSGIIKANVAHFSTYGRPCQHRLWGKKGWRERGKGFRWNLDRAFPCLSNKDSGQIQKSTRLQLPPSQGQPLRVCSSTVSAAARLPFDLVLRFIYCVLRKANHTGRRTPSPTRS